MTSINQKARFDNIYNTGVVTTATNIDMATLNIIEVGFTQCLTTHNGMGSTYDCDSDLFFYNFGYNQMYI